MHDVRMVALKFLTGHGINARTHADVEMAHFPTWGIIKTWKALSMRPCASQALMMHLIGKCVISAWTWVLAILWVSILDRPFILHWLVSNWND